MARSGGGGGGGYRGPPDCKVYVGDLGNNGDRRELEDAFGRYGPLKDVWVARNPPGFAFVQFEDPRDAEDASREMDGRTVCGRRVRVEISSGKSKPKRFGGDRGGGRDYDRDRRGGGGGRGYDRDDRYGRDRGGRGGGGRSRSRSRSPRERRRSRSPRETKRERSRSASPEGKEERRRGRASSGEKNGGSPAGDKE